MDLTFPGKFAWLETSRLEAPSITSTNEVSLAGAEVSTDGNWTPKQPQKVPVKNGAVELIVSHASAVLLRLRR